MKLQVERFKVTKMKKFIISVVFVIVLILTMSISAFAAQESEANDSAENATPINVNSTVYGNLSDKNDVDWYKFTVSQCGYFYVDFNHELIDSTSRYWNMRLYDSTAKSFIDGNDSYFYWTGKSTGGTNTFGVEPGTYYIKINRDSFSDKQYNFTVKFTATNKTETEYNNNKENADLISVNETYHGALSTNGDVDWYKFTVSQDGYFYVDFNHELIDSTSRYWNIRLYDSTGVNFIDGNDAYFYWTGKSTGGTNTFGIKAGTYYLKITKDNYSGIAYNLTINFTASNKWETENNNSKDNADNILVNETYQGALTTNGDVDWYKFTLTENGYFDIDFEHELIDSSSKYWNIRVYDSTGVNFVDGNDSYFYIKGNSNGGTNTFGVEAGTYYIKITKDNHTGTIYNLKVNFTAASNWESENNNNKNNADKITVNKVFNGTLSTNGDVDWYKFDVSSSCELAITFDHKVLDSSSTYWRIYLYDASGVTELLSWGRKGNTETGTTDYVSVSSGTYYVKVIKDNYSGVNYSLIVQEKHDCIGNFSTVKDPTCTETGTKEKNCTICGKLLDTQSIPANGHTCNNWVIDKEATCSSEGKRHCICSVCGETVSENIPMIAHSVGAWNVTKAPTCHSNGTQTRSCSKCDHIETETLSALTHEFGEWKVAQEASCYHSGTEERECSLCGDKENKTIEQLIHEYGEWEVVSGSKLIPPIVKEKTCVHCADVQSTEDWSYVWVTIVAGVVLLGVLIGVINYIRAFKRR